MEMEEFEMREPDRPEDVTETDIDLPNVPIDLADAKDELVKTSFVSDARKVLRTTGDVNPDVYRSLNRDSEGQLLYKHKRISYRQGSRLKLYSVKTLERNADSREFLRLIGYYEDRNRETMVKNRDWETVSPEQTKVIESKIASLRENIDWFQKEKEKAKRQLKQATDDTERLQLQETMQDMEQKEIQARRRYNEIKENQFKRINSIVRDETRPLSERLRELFRRDGLTIGAVIAATGMTISTAILALLPHGSPNSGPSSNKDNYTDKVKSAIKKSLVKLANWLLDLAKKALTALPGVIGSLISFLLKKAGEAVLFLSEHLVVLLLAVLLAIFEFIVKIRKKSPRL